MMTSMLTAIVLIDSDAARIPEVAAAIADLPGVSEVYSVTGEVDLIAMVRVREHDDLADVIADKVSKVEGVLRTQTYIAFRTYSPARPGTGLRPRAGGLSRSAAEVRGASVTRRAERRLSDHDALPSAARLSPPRAQRSAASPRTRTARRGVQRH